MGWNGMGWWQAGQRGAQHLPRHAAGRRRPGTTGPLSAPESSPTPLEPGQHCRENPRPV